MEKWQLQQLQSLPLEVKIRKTQERIKEWYEHFEGQVYVSFSGGKDSTVLLHIARQLYPDIEAVFVDTGLEYPEIRDFVKGFENVTHLRPNINFRQVLDRYGYPIISKEVSRRVSDVKKRGKQSYAYPMFFGEYCKNDGSKSEMYNIEKWKYLLNAPFKISNSCCDVMKKRPIHAYEKETKKKAIVGTMTDESALRRSRWLKYGCNSFEQKNPQSVPISFWKEQDVFQYILTNKIKLAECYGKIIEIDQLPGQECLEGCMQNVTTSKCKRTGCMFCMFGVHLEKEINRFQLMKETHPKQYDYCFKSKKDGGLGLGEVLDFIGVKY